MIGALAGQLGSTIVGGVLSSRANRRAKREAKRQKAETKNEYDAQIYADPRGTAQAQASITRLAEARKERAQARRGRQAVVGGTNASVAQGTESDAKAQATLESNIVAKGQERADNLRSQERSARDANQAKIDKLSALRRQQLAKAAGTAVAAGSSMFVGLKSKKKSDQDTDTADDVETEETTTDTDAELDL